MGKDKTKKENIPWVYNDIVKDHFFNPRNFLSEKEIGKFKFNAFGKAGNPVCGDMMKFWLWIDPKTKKIKECRWQTFGCGSAIASTSMLSVMVTENGGMTLDEAIKIKPKDILERLGGLPDQKIHCSVLGDKAIRNAIDNYLKDVK